MARETVESTNPSVLFQCRTQMGLELDEVKKKIGRIAAMEKGEVSPTFRQLDILSNLYMVPRWVFISESLPQQYQFTEALPVFRKFAETQSALFEDTKIRKLIAKAEQFRNLIIELREEMNEPVDAFRPPEIDNIDNPEDVAAQVRTWLATTDNYNFQEWKKKLEEKNVFVFMTSKYPGLAHVDKDSFRGLSISHSTLPIIIINDSDAKKAQSFTLFHELGHLLKNEDVLDDWNENDQQAEKWCDRLAGNILMPANQVRDVPGNNIDDLDSVKRIAQKFLVSPYACLVRLRQLEIIDQRTYSDFVSDLKSEYGAAKKKLQESKGGPTRNRSTEVLNQYGHIYTNALFQAYYNQEIGLHRLCKSFGLKRTAHALDLEKKL